MAESGRYGALFTGTSGCYENNNED